MEKDDLNQKRERQRKPEDGARSQHSRRAKCSLTPNGRTAPQDHGTRCGPKEGTREIDIVRAALKAIRGDFGALGPADW